jgi:hypothetical protein
MPHVRHILHPWLLALAIGMFAALPVRAGLPMTLTHVHGLSYSADGTQLIIPSHDGLVLFAGGRWSKAEGRGHDYMGFSATRDALYSSGHPAPGSGLPDPLGVIKSSDGGKTWRSLGLGGESDFHTMVASHATNALYLANREANSRMSGPGIFYTLTDGLTWQRAADLGRGYGLHGLAVHPTDPAVVAAATDAGLFLSRDSADSFEQLVDTRVVIAARFTLDGQHLWFSTYASKPGLARIALKTGARAEEIPTPVHTEDAVAYIAQNPATHAEFAIATFKRNVFWSRDQGRTWKQIVKDGTAND